MADDRGTGDGTGTKYQPRQEARVLKFSELTDQQKHAAFEVHALLRGYLGRKYEPSKPAKGLRRLLPHIDESRWNQNLLLDGDRGSGKTSLLVTLLQLWSDLLTPDRDDKLADDPKARDDLKAKVEEWKINPNDWPVVPLSIVDLQPLPEHTPVLLHLAEPLVRVLETIEEQENPEEPAPAWLGAEHQGLKSRKAWDELVRTIVAGWDDAAGDRWRRLDPENAEFEINRAVRGHQAVVSSFHAFVDRLIEDFKSSRHIGGRTPLFVLSVDDADMNPDRAEELLEALRMLHHPRLVFLLTGESDLFYRIAEERVARTLRSPRGRTQEDETSPVRDRLATTLARRVYDKILPPSHRCALPLLGEDQRATHLERVAKLDVKSHRHPTHSIPIKQILEEPLVGAGLPGHLRVLKDLDLLVERNDKSPAASLSTVVARVWAEAIEDAPTELYLPSQLATRVRIPSDKRPLLVEAFEGALKTRDDDVWTHSSSERSHGAHTLRLQTQPGLSTRALDPKSNKEVPQQLVGALAFADMVAFEHGVPRGAEEVSQSEGLWPRFVRVLYQTPGQLDPHLFGWPVPKGFTLLDASIVSLRWRQVVQGLDLTDKNNVDLLARWFLAVVAQLVTMYDSTFSPLLLKPIKPVKPNEPVKLNEPVKPNEPDEPPPVPDWEEVAKRVLHVAERSGALPPREIFLRDWAIGRAVLLATPESGLPVETARVLLSTFEKQASDGLRARMREASRAQRNERLRATLKGTGAAVPSDAQVDELRKQIDDQDREHPWPAFLARKLTATATAPRAVASTPTEPTSAVPPATLESAPVTLEALITAVDDSAAVRDRFLAAMGNLGMLPASDDPKDRVLDCPPTDTPLLREFTSALDERRGGSGVRPYAFKHLLDVAAQRADFSDLKGYFNATASRLEFKPLPGRYESPSMPARFPESRGGAHGLEFRDGSRYVVTSPDGRVLPPLLDFLYRCAWDTRENDQNDATGGTPFESEWGDFVSAPVNARSWVLWPSPPWRTFAHARSFAHSWKALLDIVSPARAIPIPHADLEAALAFQYLLHASSFRSLQRRASTFSFNLDFSAGQLFTSIAQSAAPPDAGLARENVKRPVIQWLRGLALLLAPESKLPEPLIATVRAAIDITTAPTRGVPSKESFWLSHDDVKPLRDLRGARMGSIISSTTSTRRPTQKLLDEIDAKTTPTHWDALLKSLESIDPPAP